jgi:hypothetical protein
MLVRITSGKVVVVLGASVEERVTSRGNRRSRETEPESVKHPLLSDSFLVFDT